MIRSCIVLVLVACATTGCLRHSDRSLFSNTRDLPAAIPGQERFEVVADTTLHGAPIGAGTTVELAGGQLQRIHLASELPLAGITIPRGSELSFRTTPRAAVGPVIGDREVTNIRLGGAVRIGGIELAQGDLIELSAAGSVMYVVLESPRQLEGRSFDRGAHVQLAAGRVVRSFTREEVTALDASRRRHNDCVKVCEANGGKECSTWCKLEQQR